MSDDNVPIVEQPRPILHLPKAKLNGNGVIRKPDGQVRHEDMMAEAGVAPASSDKE